MENAVISVSAPLPRIAMAEWVERNIVRITWKDGIGGVVDLRGPLTKHGIYRPLLGNDELFSRLRVDGHGTAIEWPGGLDLSALYISRLPFTEMHRRSGPDAVEDPGATVA